MPIGEDIENLKVLVLDNEDDYRRVVLQGLALAGIKDAEGVGAPKEALKKLRDGHYDILVTDWNLPFIRFVRHNESSPTPLIPIVLTTAHTTLPEVKAARDSGITEFVAKPLSPQSIYDHIQHAMKDERRFISAGNYKGPDRRLRDDPNYKGEERRKRGAGG